MAWYEMKGAGLPSGLQSSMDSVLNKKWGTSTTYPPTSWPDNINLMGPLPEKTVSGAIASFSDGADDVPIKSLVCNVDANLSGVSSVGVVHCGKNLIDNSSSAWEEGEINTSGQNVTGANYIRTKGYFPIKALSQFIMSGTSLANGDQDGRFFSYDKNYEFVGYFNWRTSAVTPTSPEIAYFRMRFRNTVDISALQLEYGDTATAYEAYNATTHTAQLGRTIHGGEVDVVNGTGTETYDNTSLDDLNFNYLSNITRFNVAISGADSSGYKDDIVIPTGYTISHTLITNAANAPDMTMCMYNGSLYVKNLSCTSKAELQSALSGKTLTFPLATSTDFTFDPVPINSLLGDNNLWADTGDVNVTYRADIQLALNQ